MTFDPSISTGAILNAIVLLVGFVVAFTRIGGRIDLLSMRMGSLEKAITASVDHDKRITILEERATNHGTMLSTAQREISDLRRGEGFITRHRQTIDGEYP
jgi:hypothetical protein